MSRDLLGMVVDIAKPIGVGQFRSVFVLERNPELIVKFENGYQSFENIKEWELWKAIKDTNLARWFAPCHTISGCGIILTQSRTEPVTTKELPKRIPSFFTDMKAENWGRLNGKIVCHDYGIIRIEMLTTTSGMRKAEWHD